MLSKDDKDSWLNHPGKVAVVAAVAGSIIMCVGQLFGTLLPIWFGPNLSDFSLTTDPVYQKIELHEPLLSNGGYTTVTYTNNNTTKKLYDNYIINNSVGLSYYYFNASLTARNLHPIQEYTYQIALIANCPRGFEAIISNPSIRVHQSTDISIKANLTYLIANTNFEETNYLITIEGTGSDGKKRNCNIILRFAIPQDRYVEVISRPPKVVESIVYYFGPNIGNNPNIF